MPRPIRGLVALLVCAGCSSPPAGGGKAPVTGPCEEVCPAPEACREPGVCQPSTGACTYADAADGTGCDDGDPCTTADSCAGGACRGGAPPACPAPDACHLAGTCDPASSSCAFAAAPDGAFCDDGNLCTVSDGCAAGACAAGRPVVCADGSRPAPAASCAALHATGVLDSGTYWLRTPGGAPYQAYCDMATDGGGWERVRTLALPADVGAGWHSPGDVPYLDEPGDEPPHDRVLVRLTLDDAVSWVSWDARGPSPYLNFGPALQGDLPAGRAGRGAAGKPVELRIQSWSDCYSPNSVTGVYGWGNRSIPGPPCYGTLAFFDATRVLFAVDRWAGGGPLDMGIGPAPTGSLDWTFAGNGATHGRRILEWFVSSSSAAPDGCHAPEACAPQSGSCGFAPLPDGTTCDDGDACTRGETCRQGACIGGTQGCEHVDHVLITGQSLSTGAVAVILSDVQPFGNLSFNTGVRAGGAGLTSFVPLVESWNGVEGETIASGMANLTWAMQERSGKRPFPILVSDDGVGGQPYVALKKGTAAYASGMAQITAGKAIASSLGRTFTLRAVFNVHGESDGGANNTAYEANLAEWQADYEADARAITGQRDPVPMFLCQMSSWSIVGQVTSVIPTQQLAAAKDHPGKLVLVGPKYFLPYSDGIHLTGDGERWLGEYYAKAYGEVVVEGGAWTPLQPRSVRRDGAVITVEFEVPTPPLVLDTTTVTDPGSFGFEYTDGSGSPPSITSVKLASDTSVAVTLARAPTGPDRRIRYAFTATPGVWAGPATGPRGNLRDSDATESLHGYPLWNWAVTFDEVVP